MKINEIKSSAPKTNRKRVGRGPSSKIGKTSGRGRDGQRSRSGGSIPLSFEGGQTTYFRRIPKKGFSNHPFKKVYSVFNLDQIEGKYLDGETVNRESLISKGLLRRKRDLIKILSEGDLTKSLKFDVDKISKVASDKIKAASGEILNAQ